MRARQVLSGENGKGVAALIRALYHDGVLTQMVPEGGSAE
jgi:hypothetical protein